MTNELSDTEYNKQIKESDKRESMIDAMITILDHARWQQT